MMAALVFRIIIKNQMQMLHNDDIIFCVITKMRTLLETFTKCSDIAIYFQDIRLIS